MATFSFSHTPSRVTLAFVALGLVGCETTVSLPEPAHTPRVALSYILSDAPADTSFGELSALRRLFVSSSQRVFAPRQLLGRADATVEIRDATGAVVERFVPAPINGYYYGPSSEGYYKPSLGLRPQPGQTYTLRASVPGLETAESTLTMPTAPVVESGSFSYRSAGSNPYIRQGRLTLTVRDDPGTANYYLAFARVLDQQGQPGNWSALEVDYDSQENSVGVGQFQLSSPSQKYSVYPFSDSNQNGQRLTLSSDVRFYDQSYSPVWPNEPGYIEVYVSCITTDLYNFYLSRRRYYDSDGNPFAEPAPLASNIKPGFGIFGGASDTRYRIKL